MPDDQRDALGALWHECEAGTTPEAVLPRALDRVQPAMLHEATGGVIWEKYGTTHDQSQDKMQVVRQATPTLYAPCKRSSPRRALRAACPEPGAQQTATRPLVVPAPRCTPWSRFRALRRFPVGEGVARQPRPGASDD